MLLSFVLVTITLFAWKLREVFYLNSLEDWIPASRQFLAISLWNNSAELRQELKEYHSNYVSSVGVYSRWMVLGSFYCCLLLRLPSLLLLI
ncbi:uncharacterized protein BDW70DRAFT_104840 [Aspergillus foveolatus]|uniref:uncharacterized protein n=1 Tax=Aspergillus foveolatus TaxID=210207 RepID=UPI003CCD339F